MFSELKLLLHACRGILFLGTATVPTSLKGQRSHPDIFSEDADRDIVCLCAIQFEILFSPGGPCEHDRLFSYSLMEVFFPQASLMPLVLLSLIRDAIQRSLYPHRNESNPLY